MWLLIYCVVYARGMGVSRRQEGTHIASNWHLYYYWDISSVWEYSRSTLRCTKVIGIIYITMIFVTPSGVYKNSMSMYVLWSFFLFLLLGGHQFRTRFLPLIKWRELGSFGSVSCHIAQFNYFISLRIKWKGEGKKCYIIKYTYTKEIVKPKVANDS